MNIIGGISHAYYFDQWNSEKLGQNQKHTCDEKKTTYTFCCRSADGKRYSRVVTLQMPSTSGGNIIIVKTVVMYMCYMWSLFNQIWENCIEYEITFLRPMWIVITLQKSCTMTRSTGEIEYAPLFVTGYLIIRFAYYIKTGCLCVSLFHS